MFLFNRKENRFFRKDGHTWRKKSDGKTVRETHEKLKGASRQFKRAHSALCLEVREHTSKGAFGTQLNLFAGLV